MAISRIQQSQISGSLSYDDSLTVGSGLLAKTKLSDDLNALRSLIKDIKGTGNWYQGATQDLNEIYTAMRASGANAAFQGQISSVGLASVGGDLFVAGAAGLSGSLAVAGAANLNGNVVLGDASSDSITFNAKAGSALDMNSYKITSLAQAATSGDALAWGKDASVSDLIVTGGDFTVSAAGAVSVGSTLGVTGAATLGGGLTVNSAVADFNAGITADSIKIDGDSAGRLYVVGNDGSLVDSANMWYDASGSKLYVSGAIAASGAVSAASAAITGTVTAASASLWGATLGGPLSVSGQSTLALLGVSGAASVGGNLTVTGTTTSTGQINANGGISTTTLGVSSVSTFTGAATFNGAATMNGAVSMNSLTVSGSSGLTVNNGILDVNGGMTANSIKIDGDSVGRLYVVGSDGSISDSANLWYDASGSRLYVSGSQTIQSGLSVTAGGISVGAGGLTVSAGSTSVQGLSAAGSVSFSDTLGVSGFVTMGNGASIAGALSVAGALNANGALNVAGAAAFNGGSFSVAPAASMSSLSITGSAGLSVSQGATFGGLVDVNAGMSASLIKIDGDVAQRLYIVDSDGSIKDESKLVFDGSALSITGGLNVSGNAVIDGTLQVKGAFTYVDTANMRVQDAFIYLATGSNGSVDSGIVLSKGAGNSYDLVLGQDGGAGELIFSKVATNASWDSPADLGGSALVPAWMSQAKIGSAQGTMVGSISKSGSDFLVAADGAAELKLQSAGNAAISFASASQVPDASFQASTVIGMLNELRIDLDASSAGGNLKKQAYAGTAVAAGVLDFSGLGTLSAAQHKLVDVFVNGVLMAPGYDLTGITTTTVTFSGSYSFTSDDVIVVIIRG